MRIKITPVTLLNTVTTLGVKSFLSLCAKTAMALSTKNTAITLAAKNSMTWLRL